MTIDFTTIGTFTGVVSYTGMSAPEITSFAPKQQQNPIMSKPGNDLWGGGSGVPHYVSYSTGPDQYIDPLGYYLLQGSGGAKTLNAKSFAASGQPTGAAVSGPTPAAISQNFTLFNNKVHAWFNIDGARFDVPGNLKSFSSIGDLSAANYFTLWNETQAPSAPFPISNVYTNSREFFWTASVLQSVSFFFSTDSLDVSNNGAVCVNPLSFEFSFNQSMYVPSTLSGLDVPLCALKATPSDNFWMFTRIGSGLKPQAAWNGGVPTDVTFTDPVTQAAWNSNLLVWPRGQFMLWVDGTNLNICDPFTLTHARINLVAADAESAALLANWSGGLGLYASYGASSIDTDGHVWLSDNGYLAFIGLGSAPSRIYHLDLVWPFVATLDRVVARNGEPISLGPCIPCAPLDSSGWRFQNGG